MKSKVLSVITVCLFLASCGEDDPVKEQIKEVPPCIINSIELFYDGLNPEIFEYNADFEITTIKNSNKELNFIYHNGKINQAVYKEAGGIINIEVDYNNDLLESLTFIHMSTILLKLNFYYENDELKKEEWYRADDNGELQFDFEINITMEEGNIVKEEHPMNEEGYPELTVKEYVYGQHENMLKGNLAWYIFWFDTEMFFNKNLPGARKYFHPDGSISDRTYSYTFNEKGYMTSQATIDYFGFNYIYENIDYTCR